MSIANGISIANGLKLHWIKSKAETMELKLNGNLLEFINEKFGDEGYIVAYLDYAVLMGYFSKGEAIFCKDKDKDCEDKDNDIEERYLQRLRLFNESKELYIWRSGDKFRARLRIDGEGDDVPVVDASQVLWGTRAKALGDFTKLSEDRGTNLIVPIKNVSVDEKKNRLFIYTRNYVGYTPANQATYIDCRFVKFTTNFIEEE